MGNSEGPDKVACENSLFHWTKTLKICIVLSGRQRSFAVTEVKLGKPSKHDLSGMKHVLMLYLALNCQN